MIGRFDFSLLSGWFLLNNNLLRFDWTIRLFSTRPNCAFCSALILMYKDVQLFDWAMQLCSSQQCFFWLVGPVVIIHGCIVNLNCAVVDINCTLLCTFWKYFPLLHSILFCRILIMTMMMMGWHWHLAKAIKRASARATLASATASTSASATASARASARGTS